MCEISQVGQACGLFNGGVDSGFGTGLGPENPPTGSQYSHSGDPTETRGTLTPNRVCPPVRPALSTEERESVWETVI